MIFDDYRSNFKDVTKTFLGYIKLLMNKPHVTFVGC